MHTQRTQHTQMHFQGLDGGFGGDGAQSGFERVAFAQLIDRVFLLARSFNFRVPPYFISNVRALGEFRLFRPGVS